MDWTAVSGIVGVLLGAGLTQGIQVWRWKQESDERKRLANLEDRKSAYSDYLAFLAPITLWVEGFDDYAENPWPTPNANETERDSALHLSRLRLLAPKSLVNLAVDVDTLAWQLTLLWSSVEGATVEGWQKDYMRSVPRLIKAMRDDVGAVED